MKRSRLGRRRTEFVESFRLLATRLQAMETTRRLRTVLTMSAYPRDGRTTTVLNLGIALAERGNKVLLVDADLRNPALRQRADVEAGKTLQEYLANGGAPSTLNEPAGVPTSVEGMRILSAELVPRGQPVPALSPLINLLSEEDEADYIIMDSPPCLQYADALELAPLVDGVLYVVRRRRQEGKAQRDVRAQLDRMGVNLLGLVFNRG